MEMLTVIDHFVEMRLCIREVVTEFLPSMAEKHGTKLFDDASPIKLRYEEIAALFTQEITDWSHAHREFADFLTFLCKELKYEPHTTLIDEIESWEGEKDHIKGLRNGLEESLEVALELFKEESIKDENLALLIPPMMYLLKLVQIIEKVKHEIEAALKESKLYDFRDYEHSIGLLQDSTSITDYKIAIAHLVPIFERVWFPMREMTEEHYEAGTMSEIEEVYCMIYQPLLTQKLTLTEQLALINKLVWILGRYGKDWSPTNLHRYSVDTMKEELVEQEPDLVILTNSYIKGSEHLYELFNEHRAQKKELEDPTVLGILHAALSLLILFMDALIQIKEQEQDYEYEIPLKRVETEPYHLDSSLDEYNKIRGILRKLSLNGRTTISLEESKTLDKRVKFGPCTELSEI